MKNIFLLSVSLAGFLLIQAACGDPAKQGAEELCALRKKIFLSKSEEESTQAGIEALKLQAELVERYKNDKEALQRIEAVMDRCDEEIAALPE